MDSAPPSTLALSVEAGTLILVILGLIGIVFTITNWLNNSAHNSLAPYDRTLNTEHKIHFPSLHRHMEYLLQIQAALPAPEPSNQEKSDAAQARIDAAATRANAETNVRSLLAKSSLTFSQYVFLTFQTIRHSSLVEMCRRSGACPKARRRMVPLALGDSRISGRPCSLA